MRKFKNLIWDLLIKLRIGGAVQLMLTGDLKDSGWYKSFNTKKSIDKNGNPIPWNTYPYIRFIETRLKKSFSVFEYGCGNSTLWYASKVGKINAVEHDKEWINYISKKMPSNVNITYFDVNNVEKYAGAVSENNIDYEIIIIDGRHRVNCVKNCLDYLKDNGVLIFDNSDLEIYNEAIKFLKINNFKKIDFYGMSPVTPHTNCTSIFYKENNCLEL